MKKKMITLVLSFLVIGTLQAQTWDGSSSTDWNTAANWSTNAVPTSTGVVIIPVPGVITNWPVLSNDISIRSLTMNSGSQLNTAGFNITLSNTGIGCDITGAVITNPVPANTTLITVPAGGTNLNGNTFNGNFHFSTTSGNQSTNEAATAANTWNGNTTFTALLGESLNLCTGFPSVFNGNLTINKPADAADDASADLFFVGGTITGNFTLNYDDNARLWLGNPGFTIRVGGQLNMNINNVASSLQIYGLKNYTTGGTITINNVDVGFTMSQDSLQASTISITQPVGDLSMDSCYMKGDFTFNTSNTNGNASLTLRNTIFDGDASFTTNASDIFDGNTQRCYYLGNASFSTTTGSIILSNTDTSLFYKNLTVNANASLTIRGLKFVGNDNSDFTQLGSQAISIGRIIMEKTGGARLTLNDPVAITTSVRFTGGNIYTTATNYLRFNNLVNYTEGNNSSHVVGTVQKLGQLSASAPFTFPLGADTTFNPVKMTNPGSATDIFSAEYLFKDPNIDGYDTSLHAGTLQRVSACEYWNLQRLNGTSNVTLTFTFGDPCRHNGPGILYITDPTKINIARWTGATWQDLGNGGSSGTTSGTVTTAAPVSIFSPFTFGSTDIVANPLPIKLLSFDAIKDNGKTKLVWKTTGEVNFSHFEIERSLNGMNYYPIGNVQAANSSGDHNYTGYDVSPSGELNYYRLKMVDKDGRFTQSHIVKVDFSKKYSVNILPNPAKEYIIISGANQFSQIQIVDITGKLIKQMNRQVDNRYNILGLPKGMYLVRLIGGAETITEKLIIE